MYGGENQYQYAPNPLDWIDPYGLMRRRKNGQFSKKPGPKKKKQTSKHANSLDCDLPAEGYTLRDRDTDEILKYGETTRGKSRYTQEYLDNNNARFQVEANGTKREMHQWQHQNILNFKASNNGKRPPLNKSDY